VETDNSDKRRKPTKTSAIGRSSRESAILALDEYVAKLDSHSQSLESISSNIVNVITYSAIATIFFVSGSPAYFASIPDSFGHWRLFALNIFVAILIFFALRIRNKIVQYRKNQDLLRSLISPFKQVIQKFSSLEDFGKFDGPDDWAIRLKVIEAEASYRRARSLAENRSILAIFGIGIESRYESH
jgi:hypothetical protein